MAVARRVYLYGIALVALGMLVGGLAALLELVLEALAERLAGPFASVGGDLADRVSFAGALVGIGLVAWSLHWWLAERPVRRGEAAERRSAVRKLYLYLVLFVGGLVLTFAARDLLADLVEAAFGSFRATDTIGGRVVPPLATILAAAPFWAYHARVAARDRAAVPEAGAGATLRRWCAYGLAFVGLMLLLVNAAATLTLLWDAVVLPGAAVVPGGNWLAAGMAGRVASVAAGLGLWCAAWAGSTTRFWRDAGPDPERASVLRKVYLYVVLFVAVSWTVWSLGQVLYVALRAALLPGEAGDLLTGIRRDLGATAARALAFGVAWLYHARVVEREAAAAPEVERQAGIRRVYGYLVAFIGALTLGIGVGGTLDTTVQQLAQPGTLRDWPWWAERLSLFGTLIAVGLPVWLASWTRLQREAARPEARRSLARRIYLFLTFGLSVLTLLGSGSYALYQVLRLLLGDEWTGARTSDLIDAASAAAVAALFLAYHLRVFRRDAAEAAGDAPGAPTLTPPHDADGVPDAADPPSSPALQAARPVGALAPVGAPAPTGPANGAAPVLLIRADDPAALDALERQLRGRATPGLDVERVDLDAEAVAALLREAGAPRQDRPDARA
jgi:hypothetical protein